MNIEELYKSGVVFRGAHKKIDKYICGPLAAMMVLAEYTGNNYKGVPFNVIIVKAAIMYTIVIAVMQLFGYLINTINHGSSLVIKGRMYSVTGYISKEGAVNGVTVRKLTDTESESYGFNVVAIEIHADDGIYLYYAKDVNRELIDTTIYFK